MKVFPWLAVLTILLTLTSCVPLPDVRGVTLEPTAPMRVAASTVPIDSVFVPGIDVPSSPDAFDGSMTLRFALDEPIDTIILAMPGLSGGAMGFAPLARRIVATTPGTAVWAIDRRANALEDREAVTVAMRTGNVVPVIETYLDTPSAPPTLREPTRESARYLLDWNLDVHLHDLDAIVQQARLEADRVILLGHSLGASLAAVYAAWNGPNGTGQTHLDGLVLIDGSPGRTGAFGLDDGIRLVGVPIGLPSRSALEAGRADPWFPSGDAGRVFARRQAAAVLATLDPDGPAPDVAGDVPLTNLAYAGLLHDEGYGFSTALGVSMGRVVDAELDGNLSAFLFAGRWGLRSASVVGVANGAERVSWERGDPGYERTDPHEYLADWTHPTSDVAEWYMPVTLLLDLVALPPDLVNVAGFIPNHQVTLPTLAIGSDRGLLPDVAAFDGYAEQRRGSAFSITIVDGLAHVDLLTADANPVVGLVARWASLLPPR